MTCDSIYTKDISAPLCKTTNSKRKMKRYAPTGSESKMFPGTCISIKAKIRQTNSIYPTAHWHFKLLSFAILFFSSKTHSSSLCLSANSFNSFPIEVLIPRPPVVSPWSRNSLIPISFSVLLTAFASTSKCLGLVRSSPFEIGAGESTNQHILHYHPPNSSISLV